MSSAYPIKVQSSTIPTEMQISSILSQLIQHAGGDLSTIDFSQINDEDLATIMSFLGVELEVDLDFIQELLPSDFPSTDISITIYLPEWLESSGATPDSIGIFL